MSWFNSWSDFTKRASEVAESVSVKAAEAAKTAADKSKSIATTVNETVNKFVEEQKKEYNAIEQESDLSRRKKTKKELMMESGVPPWWIDDSNTHQNQNQNQQLEIYDELKLNILKLCQDESNFLIKAPTSASVFDFKLEYALPHANKALQKDPNLPKIRFKIVPRRLTEEQFWKNYFYRVNVIRESLGIAKMDFSAPPIPTTPRNSTSTPKESKNISFPNNDHANQQHIDPNSETAAENKQDSVISVSKQLQSDGSMHREKSQSISKSKSEIEAILATKDEVSDSGIRMDLSNDLDKMPSSQQITEMESDVDNININKHLHEDEDEDFLADDLHIDALSETEKAKMKKELGIEGNNDIDVDIDIDDVDIDNVDDILAEVTADDMDDMSDGALQAELENI